jgi:small GTP-binding protein
MNSSTQNVKWLVSKKVCVLGDPAVGKTSLISRYVDNTFDERYVTTLGANISRKVVRVAGIGPTGPVTIRDSDSKDDTPGETIAINSPATWDLTLVLWDVCGQKEYKLTQESAVVHSAGFIFVCDLSRSETWNDLNYWIDTAIRLAGILPAIIIGNKSDLLKSDNDLMPANLIALAQKYNFAFFPVSAKSGDRVETAFESLSKNIISSKNAKG